MLCNSKKKYVVNSKTKKKTCPFEKVKTFKSLNKNLGWNNEKQKINKHKFVEWNKL